MSALPESVQEMLARQRAEKGAALRSSDLQAILECGARHHREMITKALELQTSCEDRDEDKWFAARHSPGAVGASLYCRGPADAAELDNLVQTYAQMGIMVAACIAQFTCGHVGCNIVHVHEALDTAAERLPEEPDHENVPNGKPH